MDTISNVIECFLSYTNKESIRQKLTYAIHNCIAIDGDDTSAGMRYE